jgi:hypothetical protein
VADHEREDSVHFRIDKGNLFLQLVTARRRHIRTGRLEMDSDQFLKGREKDFRVPLDSYFVPHDDLLWFGLDASVTSGFRPWSFQPPDGSTLLYGLFQRLQSAQPGNPIGTLDVHFTFSVLSCRL